MPPPIVNQSRVVPSEQPTISLLLLDQVGGIPGPPGAAPPVGIVPQAVVTEGLFLNAAQKSIQRQLIDEKFLHLLLRSKRLRGQIREVSGHTA
jgi:hypothetical protein